MGSSRFEKKQLVKKFSSKYLSLTIILSLIAIIVIIVLWINLVNSLQSLKDRSHDNERDMRQLESKILEDLH